MPQTLTRPRISRPEPRLSSMLGISVAVHILAVLLFAGVLLPNMQQEHKPVYVVDLVNLPVARPQAGRPDARPAAKKPAPHKSAPVKVARPAPKPKPKPKPAPPKPKVQPKPKPVAPAPPKTDYRDAVSAIEKMKRQHEIDKLKQTLAAMQAQDSRELPAVKAPLGEEKGSGDQAGVGLGLWLQSYYKQAWSLSKYQVSSLDLEMDVTVTFDARGYLKDYTIDKSSGDKRFDASVTEAVRSLDQLPKAPGHSVVEKVHFNLKELMK